MTFHCKCQLCVVLFLKSPQYLDLGQVVHQHPIIESQNQSYSLICCNEVRMVLTMQLNM